MAPVVLAAIIQQRPRRPTGARPYNRRMSWLGGRTLVALDASGLTGAGLQRGFRRGEVATSVRVSLEPGALVPDPVETSLRNPAAVKVALTDLLDRLGHPPRATLVLPMGLARFALLDPPPGTEPRDFARFRLGPTLPFAAEEAIIDVVPAGRSRVLAAAVRREVVAAYEDLAASSGLALERIDLLPLGALAARRASLAPAALDVILGDAAFAVCLHDQGEVRAFHLRWRDPGLADHSRIARAVDLVARDHGDPSLPRVLVLGEGSREVADGLRALGRPAQAGSEMAFLGAAA
jgi:hypothetical protein